MIEVIRPDCWSTV